MTTKLDIEELQKIVGVLTSLDDERRARIINSVIKFCGLNGSCSLDGAPNENSKSKVGSNGRDPVFSEHADISPKKFIFNKGPKTDIERVTCLAYYLTHYRDTKHFKTTDISNLNTESAHRKFSSAVHTINNAARKLFLVPAPKKGHKQISTFGEQYVDALPDREATKKVSEKNRPRRINKKKKTITRK